MTDILSQSGIFVDDFKLRDVENVKLVLLSHAHRDHARGAVRKFPHPIYCSYLSSTMIDHPDIHILEPNKWYDVNGVRFFVFETVHSPGSFAYFFAKQDTLFLGDTRVTVGILKIISYLRPGTILFDNTHQHFQGFFPSIETSAIMMQQVITERSKNGTKKVHLCIPHIGALLLLQMLDLKVKPHASLKPVVWHLLHTMSLVDPKSKIVAVGMKCKNINIMPSSQFFVVHALDPHKVVHVGKKLTRVFVSFHAGESEIHLLSRYNLVSLNYNEN